MGASGACRCPDQRAIPTGRLIGHWTVVGWFEGPGDLRGSWSGPGRQLLPMQFVFLGGPGGTPGMCRLSWAAGCLAWENRRAAERAVSPRRLSGRMGCGYLSKTEPVLEIDPPRKRVVPRRWDRRADRYVRLGYVRGGGERRRRRRMELECVGRASTASVANGNGLLSMAAQEAQIPKRKTVAVY